MKKQAEQDLIVVQHLKLNNLFAGQTVGQGCLNLSLLLKSSRSCRSLTERQLSCPWTTLG